MGVLEPSDLLDELREENEALLVRIAHLEATRDEYRRQMEGRLTSTRPCCARWQAAGFSVPYGAG